MKSRRDAGFTLIEITAVVIIVAMMTSLAIVRLDGMLPSTRTEAAARELLAELDFARTQSISKAQEYAVVIDFTEQRYAIQVPFDDEGKLITDPEDRPMLTWHLLQEGTEITGVMDPRGEMISEGQYALVYDPLGSAPDVHIYLRGEGSTDEFDFELTVRVLALTGIATVYTGHLEPELLVENDF
ncbi:MAG: prepilin-type N-terminal cleavage/methylation domain-containing protein [Planctomycetes bacterium]|nr:prepilin-type N-terminal cleavage/methylation domain-containing protein [Planctomycetota bacterium]MCP4860160.1 prepilin-type N-terminal cleavage/methylation domain-containing protein [Planctomycetota bacterium]